MDVRSMRGTSAISDHFIVRAKIKTITLVSGLAKKDKVQYRRSEKPGGRKTVRYKNKLKETFRLLE